MPVAKISPIWADIKKKIKKIVPKLKPGDMFYDESQAVKKHKKDIEDLSLNTARIKRVG
jgi:hypothetical protein